MGAGGYRHTQVGWVLAIATAGAVAIPVGYVVQTGAYVQAALIGFPILLILGSLSTLTVWVADDEIGLRFGLGIYRRRIDARSVRAARIVARPALQGLGIRMIDGGWRYAVGGSEMVELHIGDGRRVQIGTDEPEALLAAISSRIPERAVDGSATNESGGLWRVAILIGVSIIAGILPVLSGMQAPAVSIEGGTFTVGGALYSESVPLTDITTVTVLDTLPTVDARTNGFAAGGKLRGHFRLRGYGAASLFVDRAHPPFVMIQARGKLVIVGLPNPTETRTLADRLRVR